MKEHPTLRYHKMKVAFFDSACCIVQSMDLILENQEETTVEVDCKDVVAILPNHEDWCYIKVIFDSNSLQFFQRNFLLIQDPLTKLLVLRSIFDMVKDAKYKGSEFIDSLIRVNSLEKSLGDPIMLQEVIRFMSASLRFIPN